MLRDPLYVDSSAAVKLVLEEAESGPLTAYLAEQDAELATSVITEIECARAVSRFDSGLRSAIARMLGQFVVLPLTDSMRIRAATVEPHGLRSLDAIHLATAIEIQPFVESFVSYDNVLNDAARQTGLEVVSPA